MVDKRMFKLKERSHRPYFPPLPFPLPLPPPLQFYFAVSVAVSVVIAGNV
jgi:hypothetical protein